LRWRAYYRSTVKGFGIASLALVALAASGGLAQALEHGRDGPMRLEHRKPPAHAHRPMDLEERRWLREDLAAPPPEGAQHAAHHEARRSEARRLREEVRAGRLSREEAIRQYRKRFGAHAGGYAHRLSREEREELRRAVLEAEAGPRRR